MPSAPLTPADVEQVLRDCYDPAIPCNIVDLGLVQKIIVTADLQAPGSGIPGVPQKHRVHVDLILTTAADDPAQAVQMTSQVANRLAGLETVSGTDIHILDSPVWTPQHITTAGRRRLGLDGNPNLIQITPSL